MPNIFNWLGLRQQRELLGLIPQHMDKVIQVVDLLAEAMKAFAAGEKEKVEQIQDKVSELERQADLLRKDLLRRLSAGMFMPADRSDLVHLVERMDTVADHANGAARLLILFTSPPPAELLPGLQRMTSLLQEAAQQLGEALQNLYRGNGKAALKACDLVEAAEEETDRVKHSLLRLLYAAGLPAAELLLCHDLIEALENTADRAEDSADLVRLLAVNLS